MLQRILACKRAQLAAEKKRCSFEALAQRLEVASPNSCRSLSDSLLQACPIGIIAEIKRASPSKGVINGDLQAAYTAWAYERAGATAISVLTDEEFFHGSGEDLIQARTATNLPILRKDFVIERYQVLQARLWGADAVLLIVAALGPDELKRLLEYSSSLGLECLVEVHNEEEVYQALEAGARMIGINNRNLADFTVSLDVTLRLRPLIPSGCVVISESGIRTGEDIRKIKDCGVDGILIGEALCSDSYPSQMLQKLLSLA
jgi:indole-3-glycerol phosphate synthase